MNTDMLLVAVAVLATADLTWRLAAARRRRHRHGYR